MAQKSLKDQEQDRAFLYFLQALDATQKKEPLDLNRYNEGLNFYLKGAKPHEIVELEGEDLGLNFLVATAYANLGEFQKFFEMFYSAYPHFKGTFLDYKTRGILYLRLSQKNIERREEYIAKAEKNLRRALELNYNDGALYPILITIAKDAKKGEDVLCYLKKLSESEAMIQRSSILPYVQEAVDLGAHDVGSALVERARKLYSYSRSITAAEEILRR